jgi:hypothetical protein
LRKSPLALAALMIDSHSLSWLKMETSRAEARNVESVAVISVATIYRFPLDQVAWVDHQRPSPRIRHYRSQYARSTPAKTRTPFLHPATLICNYRCPKPHVLLASVLDDRAIARLPDRPSQLLDCLVLLSHSVINSLAQQLPSRQYQSNDSPKHPPNNPPSPPWPPPRPLPHQRSLATSLNGHPQ